MENFGRCVVNLIAFQRFVCERFLAGSEISKPDEKCFYTWSEVSGERKVLLQSLIEKPGVGDWMFNEISISFSLSISRLYCQATLVTLHSKNLRVLNPLHCEKGTWKNDGDNFI